MPARVLVVGSANVDFTVAVPRLPRPGETVSDGTLLVNHGGKGANQAVAARRLGAETRFIGCVGDDASGEAILAALAREGIGLTGAARASVATGTALIVVDSDGRNQIAVAPGANRALTVDHVGARGDDFAWADVVVCSLEVPLEAVHAALDLARAQGALTVLNPAPVPGRGSFDAWSLVDYLTPNEGEIERLSDVAGAVEGAQELRRRGVGTVIVTLGSDGAVICGPHASEECPAFRVAVVDTTAAGDAFTAGLAVALAEARASPGSSASRPADAPAEALGEAVRLASATAALTCTRRGAQDALPLRRDVERLLGR